MGNYAVISLLMLGVVLSFLAGEQQKQDELTALLQESLFAAVANGNTLVICGLLSARADPYDKNERGQTAIDIARETNNQHVISALTSRGYSTKCWNWGY